MTFLSLEECLVGGKVWKKGIEAKGFRVNMLRTKFMVSGLELMSLGILVSTFVVLVNQVLVMHPGMISMCA